MKKKLVSKVDPFPTPNWMLWEKDGKVHFSCTIERKSFRKNWPKVRTKILETLVQADALAASKDFKL